MSEPPDTGVLISYVKVKDINRILFLKPLKQLAAAPYVIKISHSNGSKYLFTTLLIMVLNLV